MCTFGSLVYKIMYHLGYSEFFSTTITVLAINNLLLKLTHYSLVEAVLINQAQSAKTPTILSFKSINVVRYRDKWESRSSIVRGTADLEPA